MQARGALSAICMIWFVLILRVFLALRLLRIDVRFLVRERCLKCTSTRNERKLSLRLAAACGSWLSLRQDIAALRLLPFFMGFAGEHGRIIFVTPLRGAYCV